MTEDATILSLPLGQVPGGRASGGVEPGGPTPVRCTLATGWRAGQIGPPLLSERPKERVPPAACRSRRQSFECVRQPSSQHGRQRPCTTFWARTPVHQLILDTQSGNTMVVLNPNQNSTSTSEAASRMSAQYLSSLYVQPLPHEVSC